MFFSLRRASKSMICSCLDVFVDISFKLKFVLLSLSARCVEFAGSSKTTTTLLPTRVSLLTSLLLFFVNIHIFHWISIFRASRQQQHIDILFGLEGALSLWFFFVFFFCWKSRETLLWIFLDYVWRRQKIWYFRENRAWEMELKLLVAFADDCAFLCTLQQKSALAFDFMLTVNTAACVVALFSREKLYVFSCSLSLLLAACSV